MIHTFNPHTRVKCKIIRPDNTTCHMVPQIIMEIKNTQQNSRKRISFIQGVV